MLLSTTTRELNEKFGYKRAVEIIAEAGFDAVDLSLVSMREDENIFNGDDYLYKAKELLKVAKANGVVFNQSHSVYPTSFSDSQKSEKALDTVKRSIEVAAAVGAKIIVVHPVHHLHYVDGNNAEILKKMNYEFYSAILPLAEKHNIIIATENMWQRESGSRAIIDSVCSKGDEFCEYIDMMNSPYFTACLDLGHCGLVGQRAEDMVRTLGNERLGAIHVHDNNGKEDNHVLPKTPWLNSIKWEEVLKALAEIDYRGDFTFESEIFFRYVTEETAVSAARYMHDIGRMFIKKIENYKKA